MNILCVHNVDCNVLIIETDPEHHDSSCSNKLHIWLDPDHATTKLSRKWLILVRRHNIEAFFGKQYSSEVLVTVWICGIEFSKYGKMFPR